MFVTPNICQDKSFGTPNIFVTPEVLLRQKTCFVMTTHVCHNKHMFVATKMALVAAPANDNGRPVEVEICPFAH